MSSHYHSLFRRNLGTLGFLLIYWTAFSLLFSAVYLVSVREFLNQAGIDISQFEDPMLLYFISNTQYLEAMIFAIIFALIFFVLDILLERQRFFRTKSILQIIIFKSLVYLAGLGLVFLLVRFLVMPFTTEPELIFDTFQPDTFSPAFYVMGSLNVVGATILCNFILQISKIVGRQRILWLFLGRYHQPRTEEYLIMFIDLVGSTSTAERLGHLRFSRLLQWCFFDMNLVLERHRGYIYQYAGDEAIIMWQLTDDARKNADPLDFFFAFQGYLEKRKEHYNNTFGLVPQFHASLHGGTVTASEIGIHRQDIAYHGDAMNTTARLQKLCKKYNAALIASEWAWKQMENPRLAYVFAHKGQEVPKGKTEPMLLYSVSAK